MFVWQNEGETNMEEVSLKNDTQVIYKGIKQRKPNPKQCENIKNIFLSTLFSVLKKLVNLNIWMKSSLLWFLTPKF